MKVAVSLGRTDIGVFDTHQLAVEAASNYASEQGIHHQYDWQDIRRRVGFVSQNSSFGMDGWYFKGVAP